MSILGDMGEIKRKALVVGINRYPLLKETGTSEARHLTTAVRDAESAASPYLLSITTRFPLLIQEGSFLAAVCGLSLLSTIVVT